MESKSEYMVDIQLASLAARLIDAFNKADWAAFTDGVTSDVTYLEIGTGRHAQGANAYLKLLRVWKQAFPDGIVTIRNAVSDGNTVVQEFTWSGTHTGPFMTPAGKIPATAKRVEIRGTLWIMFHGRCAGRVHSYLDMFGLLTQLGWLPG
jgi:steroid delta-isomerase-like uncharacterized protein